MTNEDVSNLATACVKIAMESMKSSNGGMLAPDMFAGAGPLAAAIFAEAMKNPELKYTLLQKKN